MNWQDIDTSTTEGLRALDVEIAKRLGYRFERRPYMNEDSTLIYFPDGTQAYTGSSVFNRTAIFNLLHMDVIPHYTTDLNAAASLPFDLPYGHTLCISRYADGSVYSRVLSDKDFPLALTPTAECFKNEALSRSLTWLRWIDVKESEGE